MTIAPPPPLPSPDAEADVWTRYFQELENYKAATARLHAQAQADTAANMLTAAQKTADAQDRFVAAMKAPSPPPTREARIWQAMLSHPQVTGMTELNVADHCVDLVDAFIRRNPGATS